MGHQARNAVLLHRYSKWLVCQRYSRTGRTRYNRIAERFSQFWGRRSFAAVGPADIRDFLIEMSERDLSGDVVHQRIWALRSFFDFLCLQGVADDVAPRFVRTRPEPRRLLRALSRENVMRLIDATTNPRDRAILELLYATGCRPAEFVGIRLEHIDFARRTIIVHGKCGDRRVFFGLTAKRAIRKYLNGRNSGYLFESRRPVQKGCVSWNGSCWGGYWLDYSEGSGIPRSRCVSLGPASLSHKQAWATFRRLVPNPDRGHVRPKPQPLTRYSIANILKEAAHRAGLGRVTAYNLRHSFAAHMLDGGADIRQVQELLGHRSVASTNRYSNVASVLIGDAYRKFHPRS